MRRLCTDSSRFHDQVEDKLIRGDLCDMRVEMDQWFRRRIRMCYWKQLRRARKRIRELNNLGVGERHAILAGLSMNGYWHLANTEAMNVGLSNAYLLKEQGLTSLRTLWIKIYYPATAS